MTRQAEAYDLYKRGTTVPRIAYKMRVGESTVWTMIRREKIKRGENGR